MRGKLILQKQTEFQLIHLVQYGKDLVLYIDGIAQFSSKDEYRYHETLVHPAMSLSERRENVLIIGGGDGLAAREILKYEDVLCIKLVDIDPEIVELCSATPLIAELNRGAFSDPRVKYIPRDAWVFIQETTEFFDVIIVDLPDPEEEVLAKLYSHTFYHMLGRRLLPGGIISVQSTGIYLHNMPFWCIYNTIKSTGLYVKPLHAVIPSFGDWVFMLVSNKEFDTDRIKIQVETRYLEKATSVKDLFKLKENVAWKETLINTVNNYAITGYYDKTSLPAMKCVLPLI